jgi:hypothetical protein
MPAGTLTKDRCGPSDQSPVNVDRPIKIGVSRWLPHTQHTPHEPIIDWHVSDVPRGSPCVALWLVTFLFFWGQGLNHVPFPLKIILTSRLAVKKNAPLTIFASICFVFFCPSLPFFAFFSGLHDKPWSRQSTFDVKSTVAGFLFEKSTVVGFFFWKSTNCRQLVKFFKKNQLLQLWRSAT